MKHTVKKIRIDNDWTITPKKNINNSNEEKLLTTHSLLRQQKRDNSRQYKKRSLVAKKHKLYAKTLEYLKNALIFKTDKDSSNHKIFLKKSLSYVK